MKVLKICINEWKNASRDKRELSVCNELGYDTVVMAKGGNHDTFVEDYVDGFRVYRFTTRPLGNTIPSFFNKIASILYWAKYAKSFEADVISGHDIIAVLIAWLSNIFSKKKSILIYDSHEFEPGRNVNRSALKTWLIMRLEKFLIKKCLFTIIPCDSAADDLKKIYHLKNRPLVVRSTPDLVEIDYDEVKAKRVEFEKFFGNDITFIVMYHGGIMENRGLDLIIDAIYDLPYVGLLIVGEILGQKYYDALLDKACCLNMTDRILYHEAVPHKDLYKYVSAADAGMITIIPKTKSYYYALPNKFFENIQSLTPVIASNLPEMRRIINKYDIGILIDIDETSSIKAAIEEMSINKELYATFRNNLKYAKTDLCWEKEKIGLKNKYKGLA